MFRAIELAKSAADIGEVPVGACLVRDGVVLAEAANYPIGGCDPTAHAEILTLRRAAERESNYRLPDSTMYITIEPCAMCLGAMVHARVARIVVGALEPKAGVLVSNTGLVNDACFNHHFTVETGVLGDECAELMTTFFKHRRALKTQVKKRSSTLQR